MSRAPNPLLPLALALALLAACGDRPAPQPQAPPPSTTLQVPDEPEAALAWVRAAEADPAALRARLEAWPLEAEPFTFVSETQIALTWRLRLALQDLRIDDACASLARLEEDYEGEGETPEGESFPRRTLALAIFESALRAAQETMAATSPDAREATRLLTRAEALLDATDAQDRARLEGLRRWLLAENITQVCSALGLPRAAPDALARGALVFVDDFVLGELPVTDILARWQREGAHLDLIPVLRGQVRMGLRRLPAESAAAELVSIQEHARQAGLPTPRSEGLAGSALDRLGLGPQDVLLFLHDDRGRIVGRLAGIIPQLRALDPIVQRLVSRSPPAPRGAR